MQVDGGGRKGRRGGRGELKMGVCLWSMCVTRMCTWGMMVSAYLCECER